MAEPVIKEKIGNDEFLNNVYIKGEISNFKHHYTGHMYFTLKDKESLIKCIMFKSYTANLNFVPKDGIGGLRSAPGALPSPWGKVARP